MVNANRNTNQLKIVGVRKNGTPIYVDAGGKEIAGMRGAGDLIEKIVKPIAKLLKMDCLDGNGLKPESPCAKRRDAMNKVLPFNQS
jgi:hypothetical protein